MPRSRRYLAVALLVAVLAVLSPAGVRAADPKNDNNWTGKLVIGKKPDDKISFGDRVDGKQVSFRFEGLYPIKVREDRDGWLRIFDGHREGWGDKDDFVLSRDAASYFTDRINANPKDAWAWGMRAISWNDRGEYDNAIKDRTEEIRLKPDNSHAFNGRGNAWLSKKEYDKAIADYDEAIRLDPKFAVAFNNRGNAWRAKKEYDKAIADYDEAIRLDPRHAAAYSGRGIALAAERQYDRAIADFTEIIRVDPSYAAIGFSSRGNIWRAKKEYDKAIADYNEAIRLDPKEAHAFFSRAVVYLLLRKPEATAGFRSVLELQDWKNDRTPYAVVLGHLSARQSGDSSGAQRFLNDSGGKLADAWPYPAVRYFKGEIDEAKLLELAVDDDKRTEARCFLGLDHALKGNKEAALAHLRWVKEHGTPSFIEYTIAVAELERLEREDSGAKP
jgi:tetratricopeptide (TPR) repeat protein